jgi:tetratricopeptide (TPR) repeat protein
MLLDFNMAEDTKRRGGAVTGLVGGTIHYMAPEQLGACRGEATEVDGRCDLYALRVILYELLAGRHPFVRLTGPTEQVLERELAGRHRPPPPPSRSNPPVTPAVDAIVRRCLQPDPLRRYQSARELQEDLDRQRNHLPLRHTPTAPSLRERARKWLRRHPRLASSTSIGSVALLLVALLAGLLVLRGYRAADLEARQEARAAWERFEGEARKVRLLLYTRLHEPDELEAGIELCTRALGRYGVLADAGWKQAPRTRSLEPARRQQLGEAAAELLLLLARAQALRADRLPSRQREEVLREALRLTELAAACSDRAAAWQVLWLQRGDLAEALGETEEARRCRSRAETLPPESARDLYWQASGHLLHGRTRDALPLLLRATQQEPDNFWAWFVLGNCHERQGQDARAEACYGTCIALRPDFVWPHFNRGLARLRQRHYAPARADFDRALELQPGEADFLVNRALAWQGLGRYAEGVDDLTRALELGRRGRASRSCVPGSGRKTATPRAPAATRKPASPARRSASRPGWPAASPGCPATRPGRWRTSTRR